MTVNDRVSTDTQLARLLQIGIVLEEVVEVRAARHYETLSPDERDDDIEELLEDAREESADHRQRLEALIDQLDAEAVPLEEVEALVEATYAQTGPEDFDGVLYDQLHGEETAYKFYDDLIGAIEASDTAFALDREELLATLKSIREEEAEGVEEVTEVMEARE
ncbi:ferritin-like domain-containing protein [Halorussus salinisoli]|uniref:ferritin-like domain-containing protein n=1 Tax=Halorussus salinisoli TaxID=2558242 RepID=UPI0010C23EC3|nr:ferritin-like domain-containing protein [Halorussus salinisoli]